MIYDIQNNSGVSLSYIDVLPKPRKARLYQIERNVPIDPEIGNTMHMDFTITLPQWLTELLKCSPKIFPTQEDRMRFIATLARENVLQQTGGPFGAGVFDSSGRLVAAGVNLVVSSNCSIFHAEIVAIALAQKKLGRYDISDGGHFVYELVASTEPCAMCFGAIPWSGITRLVCGARDEDARSIGFDEGPKLPNWQEALEKRGILVSRDVLRGEAVACLISMLEQAERSTTLVEAAKENLIKVKLTFDSLGHQAKKYNLPEQEKDDT